MLPEGDLVLLEGANVGDCCLGYLRRRDVSEFCSLWLSSYQLFFGDFPERGACADVVVGSVWGSSS